MAYQKKFSITTTIRGTWALSTRAIRMSAPAWLARRSAVTS